MGLEGDGRVSEFAILFDRALGTFIGGALGDALGMPTQSLSRARIKRLYGVVDRFVAPREDHPVSHGLAAGTITDDTQQTLLLGRVLLASRGGFDQAMWIEALLSWERDAKARGGHDLLGPSTKRALDAMGKGAPADQAGRFGDTNGAAMRVSPLGVMTPARAMETLVERTAESCRATHGAKSAIAAASAVAAAVSWGIECGDWRLACARAIEAARLGASYGWATETVDMAEAIIAARKAVRGKTATEAARAIVERIGVGVASAQSAPAAFAVVEIAGGDPWTSAVISANLGGDTDTIGAIAASIAGACAGFSRLPPQRIGQLRGLDMQTVETLAGGLLEARLGAAAMTASRAA